jgi:hypothetical protein
MKTKELSFAKVQKSAMSAEVLERKGDSSSKGANLKAGEGQRGRQVHLGIFWKECAISCGQRSCETLFELKRGKRAQRERMGKRMRRRPSRVCGRSFTTHATTRYKICQVINKVFR